MSSNSSIDLGSISEQVEESELRNTKEESEIFNEKNERSKNKHKHYVFIISVYIIWGMAIAIVVLRAYHYISPICWRWLDVDQLQALDKLLFSGAVGTILGRYGKNLIG